MKCPHKSNVEGDQYFNSRSTCMSLLPRETRFGTRGGTWLFFGWVCAARDSKLAPRSKKKFP